MPGARVRPRLVVRETLEYVQHTVLNDEHEPGPMLQAFDGGGHIPQVHRPGLDRCRLDVRRDVEDREETHACEPARRRVATLELATKRVHDRVVRREDGRDHIVLQGAQIVGHVEQVTGQLPRKVSANVTTRARTHEGVGPTHVKTQFATSGQRLRTRSAIGFGPSPTVVSPNRIT